MNELEKNEFIERNYFSLGYKEISKLLCMSESSVRMRAHRLNLQQKANNFISDNYEVYGYEKIASILGMTSSQVRCRASKLGVSKKRIDISVFDTWTEQSAYLLGMFISDGSLVKGEGTQDIICFCQKDKPFLENIREILKSNYGISKNNTGTWTFKFPSQPLSDKFRAWGIPYNKSCNRIRWPEMPDEVIRHFLRGMVDGDGCISLMHRDIRLMASSNNMIMEEYSKAANILNLPKPHLYKSKGIDTMVWLGEKAIFMSRYLYFESSIFLQRKKQRAERMFGKS